MGSSAKQGLQGSKLSKPKRAPVSEGLLGSKLGAAGLTQLTARLTVCVGVSVCVRARACTCVLVRACSCIESLSRMPWFRAGPVPRPRPEVLGEEGAQRLSLQGRKSWRGRPLIAFSGERAHDFYPLASQKMFCWGAKVL